MTERGADLILAAVLATLPLLPAGAQYVGLSATSWAEGTLLLLIALLCVTPHARKGTSRASTSVLSLAGAGWVVAPFIIATTGGALVGLLSNNVMTSSAFLANLREFPMRLFAPMNQGIEPLYPLRVWLTFVEGPAAFFLVVVICRRASDPQRRARAALGGAVVGLAIVSGFAVFQYAARFHLNPHWVQADPDLVRSDSTFEDPNTLGSYLVLGLGLSVAGLLRERIVRPGGWRAWLMAGALVVASAALVTSVSRAALGAAVLSALFLAAYGPPWNSPLAETGWSRPVRRIARRAVAVMSVLLLVWLAAGLWLPTHAEYHPTSPFQAVLETIDPRVPLAQVLKGRPRFWIAALHMAQAHPIAGVGLGRYPRLVSHTPGVPMGAENAHNFFLQLLAEMGGVGLLTFLLIAVSAGWALNRAARAGGANAGLVWGLSFGFLAFSLTLVAGHPLLLPSVQIVAGTSLAAGLVATFTSARDAQRRWPSPGLAVATAAALAIVYGTAIGRTSWQSFGDQWGYYSGLYGLERDQSRRSFRWSGREALLYVVLPDSASTARLNFAVFPPPDGHFTTVTVEAAGQRFTVACPDDAWRQVSLPIDAVTAARGAVEIRFDVDRVFVPARLGPSADVRELGAMLRSPMFAAEPAGR